MGKEPKKHQILHNIERLIQELKTNQRIPNEDMHYLIQKSSLLMKNQPNLLRLTSPLTIVGDIHGQFYDLVNLFSIFGCPPRRQFLFLGDFIDRGTFSIQVITLLLALKLCHPQSIHLLRGNHESRCMTTAFNFRQECLAKYDQKTYDSLMRLFDELPLCAIVDNKYFAVHAGISPSCQTLEQIQQLNRFQQVPQHGGLCDLLWSDPSESLSVKWQENDNRKCSYYFGVNQAKSFLNRNGLKLIIRGHQVDPEGFRYQKAMNVPLTLTIFSAPNYSNHNKGSVAEISPQGGVSVRTFSEVQHPVCLPNFMNLFEWSLPFVVNCTDHLFKHLLKLAPIKDKKINEIMHCKQAFYEDYQRMRRVMLIDEILKIQCEQKGNVQSYPKRNLLSRRQSSNGGNANVRQKSGDGNRKGYFVEAKVIGPKLDDKEAKIGSIKAEEQEKDVISLEPQ